MICFIWKGWKLMEFANKLWNAARFVLMNLDEKVAVEPIDKSSLEEEDRWIISD